MTPENAIVRGADDVKAINPILPNGKAAAALFPSRLALMRFLCCRCICKTRPAQKAVRAGSDVGEDPGRTVTDGFRRDDLS